jgi:MYXO-CTERM domain-containing protein
VDKGCAGKACDAGQHCAAGDCVDDCADAQCPGGAACHEGVCEPPSAGNGEAGAGGASDGSGNGDNTFGGDGIDLGNGTAATGNVATGEGGNAGEEGNGAIGKHQTVIEAKGCSCRLVAPSNDGWWGLLAAAGALAVLERRRRAG